MAQLDILLGRQPGPSAVPRKRWSPVVRRTLALGVLNVATLWIVAGAIVWQGYRDAIDDASRTAINLSLTTAGYTQHAVGAADQLLKSMLDWLDDEDIETEGRFDVVLREKRFHDAMRDRLGGLPQASVASIFDRSGNLLSTSLKWPAADLNVAHVPSFNEMLDPTGPDRVATASLLGRLSGKWTFYIARKVLAKGGSVLGIAIVGLDPAYFASLFHSLVLGENGWVTLFRDDGALLATSLDRPDLAGKSFPEAIPVRLVRDGYSGQAVMVDGPAWWDAAYTRSRLAAPRRVEGFPYLVSVNIAEATILARWAERSWLIGGLAFAISVAAGLVTGQVMRLSARSEETARQAFERRMLSALIDTPVALAAVVDREGNVIYCNERFRTLMAGGGETRHILQHPSVRHANAILDYAAQGGGAPLEADIELVRPDGAERYLHFSVSTQTLPEVGPCTILVGHDETLRRQAQKALTETSKLVTLGEMTTGMAHELSQPLNVIRMAAQNALTETRPAPPEPGEEAMATLDDEDYRKFVGSKLHRIMAQVDRAASIIARMRVFGRRPEGAPSVIDVRDVCRDALALLEQRLRNDHIQVSLSLPEAPLRVRAHPQLAEQVMVNLMLNAIDALRDRPADDRRLRIDAASVEGRIHLTVADNGPGVPADLRDRIFEPFFTSKAPGQGTGLGLSLSYGLVREAGGTLSLLPGERGATFRIELPESGPEAGPEDAG